MIAYFQHLHASDKRGFGSRAAFVLPVKYSVELVRDLRLQLQIIAMSSKTRYGIATSTVGGG